MNSRMNLSSLFLAARRFFRLGDKCSARLIRGDSGAVTVVFAICGSLMMVTMAIALDSIQGAMVGARLTSAEDVTALSAAQDSARYVTTVGTDLANWQKDVKAYFQANLPSGTGNFSMTNANITATMADAVGGGRTISVHATGTLQFLLPINLPWVGGSTPQQEPTTEQLTATDAALYVPPGSLEVVMVLDNTGSMADVVDGQSKIDGLKSAANDLVTAIFQKSNANSYIGIVPFRTTVNVSGALSASGNWLSPKFSYNSNGMSMAATDSTHPGWAGCAVEPRDGNGYLYPEAYSPASSTKFTPYYYNVPPSGLALRKFTTDCSSSSTTTATYIGLPFTKGLSGGGINACGVTPAGTGLGTTYDTAKGVSTGSWNPTQNSDCIDTPVTFLTQNATTLTTAINSMNPSGSTIIPTGILWGWRMLSSTWSQAIAGTSGWISTDKTLPRPETTPGLNRVMIVLTDGENQVGNAGYLPNDLYFNGLTGVGSKSVSAPTVTRTDGSSLSNGTMDSSETYALPSSGTGNSADVNTFQLAACQAIKNSGVTIYALTFGDVSNVAAATMTACATPTDSTTGQTYYYHAPNGAALQGIFQQIANNLGTLRLTQ